MGTVFRRHTENSTHQNLSSRLIVSYSYAIALIDQELRAY